MTTNTSVFATCHTCNVLGLDYVYRPLQRMPLTERRKSIIWYVHHSQVEEEKIHVHVKLQTRITV